MTGPFDTVSDIEDWIATEPTYVEVEEALEIEKENANRKTGKEVIKSYIDSLPEPGGDDESVEFRVQTPHGDYLPGDTVELDPTSVEAQRLRRAGTISR